MAGGTGHGPAAWTTGRVRSIRLWRPPSPASAVNADRCPTGRPGRSPRPRWRSADQPCRRRSAAGPDGRTGARSRPGCGRRLAGRQGGRSACARRGARDHCPGRSTARSGRYRVAPLGRARPGPVLLGEPGLERRVLRTPRPVLAVGSGAVAALLPRSVATEAVDRCSSYRPPAGPAIGRRPPRCVGNGTPRAGPTTRRCGDSHRAHRRRWRHRRWPRVVLAARRHPARTFCRGDSAHAGGDLPAHRGVDPRRPRPAVGGARWHRDSSGRRPRQRLRRRTRLQLDQLGQVWPSAPIGRGTVLGTVQRRMVELLEAAPGASLDRASLIERCRQGGINLNSALWYLTYSECLERLERGRYGVRGAPVQAWTAVPRPARYRRAYGLTRAGHPWMALEVTAANSPAASSTSPPVSALRSRVAAFAWWDRPGSNHWLPWMALATRGAGGPCSTR